MGSDDHLLIEPGAMPPFDDYPMFPLATPLLPGVGIPMQIFEPRYLEMYERQRDRIAHGAHGEFGVVMIQRGAETGGGEVRSSIACRAVMLQPRETADRRVEFVALGVERIRVKQWHPDAPFPRASVVSWPDVPGPRPPAERRQRLLELADEVRRLAADLGDASLPSSPDFELGDDPSLFGLAAIAGLGPFDLFSVLAAPSEDERSTELLRALEDQLAVLKFRQTC